MKIYLFCRPIDQFFETEDNFEKLVYPTVEWPLSSEFQQEARIVLPSGSKWPDKLVDVLLKCEVPAPLKTQGGEEVFKDRRDSFQMARTWANLGKASTNHPLLYDIGDWGAEYLGKWVDLYEKAVLFRSQWMDTKLGS
jgi:hypothetical protein